MAGKTNLAAARIRESENRLNMYIVLLLYFFSDRKADHVNLMSYDFFASSDAVTGVNSPLFASSTATGDRTILNTVMFWYIPHILSSVGDTDVRNYDQIDWAAFGLLYAVSIASTEAIATPHSAMD
jgi:hypothetical protein